MNLLEKLKALLSNAGDAPQERSIHLDGLLEQIRFWSYQNDVGYFSNLYVDEQGLWAIFDKMGQLTRALIAVVEGEVILGELQPVVATYTPVERSAFVLRELDNGDVRFVLIAATAVINRVQEIDSTQLFDNMIQRAESLDLWPRIDFYHLGSVDPVFEFGECDFLARDGICYIASGILEGSHPLTRAILNEERRNPGGYGASIEYMPIEGAYEEIEAGGIKIRCFHDGINTRIALLPEKDAAAHFTSLSVSQEVNRMKQRSLTEKALAELKRLLGEEATTGILGQSTNINRQADANGMIYRADSQPVVPTAGSVGSPPAASAPATPQTPQPTTTGNPDTGTAEAPKEGAPNNQQQQTGTVDTNDPIKDAVKQAAGDIVIDEATLNAIAAKVAEMLAGKQGDQLAQTNGAVEKAQGEVAELQRSLAQTVKRLGQLEEELQAIRQPIKDQVAKAREDMAPAQTRNVIYRPSQQRAEAQPADESTAFIEQMDEAAKATLAKLKKVKA